MLINTSYSLFVVRHGLTNRIIVSSDIWSDLATYPAISHYHFFYKICWSLSFPRAVSTLTLCAFAPPVGKCNNVRPVELPDNWPPNSPGLSTFHYKILGNESTTKSGACEWFEAESVWCVSWSVTERYWRWHWSVAQTSSCLHLSYRMTVYIFSPWHKLAKTLLTVIN